MGRPPRVANLRRWKEKDRREEGGWREEGQ